jgi:class 3 adenylate cyclase/tetratricopeptide (TPR) repeat protein
MKCSECRDENRDGAKFCNQCGAKLQLQRLQCRNLSPPDSKFCSECGHGVPIVAAPLAQDVAFEEKLGKIQKYLPNGLTEKILAQKDRIECQRRQVTVMFVDMAGFTPLSEKLGPEGTLTLMNQVFEIIINKIDDYEGALNELTGDGVLALFGAPIALEDAPQRAIRSALAIHKEMIEFNERIKGDYRIQPILLRIGINTGPAVVGSIGSNLRLQFGAVGDTVNMASRMENLAEPGTTYVTEQTFKLTNGFFRFEALGPKQIKGKEKPVEVYRVIAASGPRTRFDVSTERGLTPLIARRRELELLLDGFERTKASSGQAFGLVGEAGLGKSRLLYEFRKAVANENVTLLEGKCLSYGKAVPYHPIIDILKSNFDVADGDTDSTIWNKVSNGLKMLDEATSTLPYVLELLSVKDSGIDKIPLSPGAKKDRISDAIKRIVLKRAEIRPLILAIEDLHWMDKSSEDIIKHLFASVPGARVMLLLTYRPEFAQAWNNRSYCRQLNLNRLSNSECRAMVHHILGIENVDRDLEELIVQKTEGIPFFIEEFIESLRALNALEQDGAGYRLADRLEELNIPSTIQDVIMARVDSLPDSTKAVLQAGSAIEREFSYELIKAVTDLPEQELLSHLSAAKEAELLYERGIFPQSTYVFRHALTRDVVYDAILTKRKKLLHQKIGKAIEEVYRDSLDDYHSALADHFMVSQDFEKSAEYSRLTYERARLQAALTSAISYAQKRVKALESLPPTPEVQQQLIDASVWLGLTLFTAGHVAEAKKAVERIAEKTLKSNDKKRLTEIYTILGAYKYSVEENVGQGLELLEDAVQNAAETTDARSATLAHFYYGEALCLNCQFESGAESIRKAISIQESVQNLWAVSTLYSHLSHYAYNCQGKVDEGFATSLKAMKLAESSGDIHSRGHAYVCHGVSCFYKGFFEEAEQHLLKGIDLYEHHPVPAIGHQALGYLYFEKGDFKKSQTHYRKAILFREQTGVLPSRVNLNKVALARTDQVAGQTDLDIQSLVQLVRETKPKLYHGTMARHLAEILFHKGEAHFKEAESWLQIAILNHEEGGMKWDLASDYMVLAQLMKLEDRPPEDKDYSHESSLLFTECGADGWVTSVEEELAKLG